MKKIQMIKKMVFILIVGSLMSCSMGDKRQQEVEKNDRNVIVVQRNDFNKSKLDSLFHYLEENDKLMGSIALSHNGSLIYSNAIGFADIETQTKATNETKYRIGSISKLFTATLIMQAVEAKKLDLSNTIEGYFPTLKNADKISIEYLLRHRSGIHNITDDDIYETYYMNPKTRQEMLDIIAACESDFEPNEKGAYSNSNYILLSIILERINNSTINELVESKISKTLKLTNTYYGSKIDLNNKECNSYHYSEKWIKEKETDMSIPLGAGAIVSTPSDLTRFIEALFSEQLVSQKSLDKMLTLTAMDDMGIGYGYGILEYPVNKKGYGHTGGIDGFISVLLFFPEANLSFALCTNASNYSYKEILKTALSSFYNEPIEFVKK